MEKRLRQREYQRKYYEKNKDHINANRKKKGKYNAEKVAIKNKKYREANRERMNQYQKVYRERIKEQKRALGIDVPETRPYNRKESVIYVPLNLKIPQKEIIEVLKKDLKSYLWNVEVKKWTKIDLTEFNRLKEL